MGHFLTVDTVRAIQSRFGTPVHVYDMATLVQAARRALSIPAPFGLALRDESVPQRGYFAHF